MKKLSVNECVMKYQATKDQKYYLMVLKHYAKYKEYWYQRVSEYIDRRSFDSEFALKLYQAICHFDISKALDLTRTKQTSQDGMFNRFFYQSMIHWKANIKSSCYRVKNRPCVLCPICGRWTTKIDEEHLKHYKTVKDLPRAFAYEGKIYQTRRTPGEFIASWGGYSGRKLHSINDMSNKWTQKKVDWPWHDKDGHRLVVCPYTKSLIPKIDNAYLKTLPDKYNRYATPMTWLEFDGMYPNTMLDTEIYSLEYQSDSENEEFLVDNIEQDIRLARNEDLSDKQRTISNGLGSQYESLFLLIDSSLFDEKDRQLLKLIATGHENEEIAEFLQLNRKELSLRIENIRSKKDIEETLLDSLMTCV